MRAEQSLQEGNLQEALTQLQQQIRQDPAKVELRVFLFQLLAVTGQWDRALTQLNVAGEMDASTLPMVQTYREALNRMGERLSEEERARVIAEVRAAYRFNTETFIDMDKARAAAV